MHRAVRFITFTSTLKDHFSARKHLQPEIDTSGSRMAIHETGREVQNGCHRGVAVRGNSNAN